MERLRPEFSSGRIMMEQLPGVIHLTDAGGTRPSHITMARRLAEQGYTVLVPNLFYRTGGKPAFVNVRRK